MGILLNSRLSRMKKTIDWKIWRLYIQILVCLLFVCRLQRWADTNVTLAFEETWVIPPFSSEETDYTDDTDMTDDADNTDDTNDTDNTIDTNDTFLLLFCYFSTTFLQLFRYFSDTFPILFRYFSATFLTLFRYFSATHPILVRYFSNTFPLPFPLPFRYFSLKHSSTMMVKASQLKLCQIVSPIIKFKIQN